MNPAAATSSPPTCPQLYAERLKLANPADHVVLPEVISKEPLGPMVRHGDDQWFDIVKWTLFAMVDAEELGITQKNVDEMAKSDKPELKRAFGTDGNLGEQLGLTKDWVSRIVKAVGNYGEVFRAQRRLRLQARHRPRPQQPLEQGRYPVRAADPLIADRGQRRWPSNPENHRRSLSPNCSARSAAGRAGAALSSRSCSSRCWPGSPTKSSPMPAPICRRSGSPRASASCRTPRALTSARA